MLQYFLPQKLAVEVGVYFGRRDAFVPEHLLNGPQIGPSFQQVRGKGVTKGMRTHFFLDSTLFASLFHNIEDHYPRQLGASTVQEKYVFVPPFYRNIRSHPVHCNRSRDGTFVLVVSRTGRRRAGRPAACKTERYAD